MNAEANATTTDADLINAAAARVADWSADQAACNADAAYIKPDDAVAHSRAALGRIIAMRATTLDGMRAKARVLTRLDYNCDDLVASLCVDLA